RQSLEWLPKGRELLTIKIDCDLTDHLPGLPSLEALAIGGQDSEALKVFSDRYGFKGLVKQLVLHEVPPELIEEHKSKRAGAGSTKSFDEPDLSGTRQATNLHYEIVLDWDMFDRWLVRLQSSDLVALDTETTSLDEMRAEIVGLSFSAVPGEAAYIPLRHSGPDAPAQLPFDEVLARLKPWLEDGSRKKVGQHIKYDRHVFANHGIEVQGYAHDTMLQSYVLEVHKPHGLASLAERHLGRSGIDYEDICGKGAHQIPFSQVDVAKAAEYSCEDSDQTLDVHMALWPRLQADERLLFVYRLEMESSEALYRVERNGVLIDAATLAAQSHELGQRIMALEAEAHALAGQPFNLGSPKQIGEIFFTKLGLPVVKKTATGAPSTDEEVLEKLAEDFPLPARILEHRGLSKLKGTYTDKLTLLTLPRTGRVHTHYAQAVAVTGRLSSNDPNLQNIPIRTPEGRRVREAFVAPADHLIASADYSQIELRIMAHISGDEALLRAFTEGMDVHRATAAEVFSLAPEQVSSEQRRYAKVINFGLIYGMSAFGLARSLAIDTTAARNYIERYFQRYPGVKRYMDETRISAKQKGYVETVFGRRLYLPEINSPNGPRRSSAERQAINAPMQGTAADLIKLSMVEVQRVLDAGRRGTRMIMQVHDELVFEVQADALEPVSAAVREHMAGAGAHMLKVPLGIEIGSGANWDEAH
ncbi:MAG: DNA polymerase I, partial [Variovorax sp.]